jgi:hypothetical protein
MASLQIYSSVEMGRWYNNSGSNKNLKYFRDKKIWKDIFDL